MWVIFSNKQLYLVISQQQKQSPFCVSFLGWHSSKNIRARIIDRTHIAILQYSHTLAKQHYIHALTIIVKATNSKLEHIIIRHSWLLLYIAGSDHDLLQYRFWSTKHVLLLPAIYIHQAHTTASIMSCVLMGLRILFSETLHHSEILHPSLP